MGIGLFQIVIFSALINMLPFVLLLMTAYIKISVVFNIVRNALGVQQTPPNIVLSGVATILALYISAPVAMDAYERLRDPAITYNSIDDWERAGKTAMEPMRVFLQKHTRPSDREFFISAASQLWGKEKAQSLTEESIIVLTPAFVMRELTAAFEIGFLLYLPFIAVDLIVSNVLMALGMMMVSPVVISVPFKLFLFVAIDGWNKMVHGLILSYV